MAQANHTDFGTKRGAGGAAMITGGAGVGVCTVWITGGEIATLFLTGGATGGGISIFLGGGGGGVSLGLSSFTSTVVTFLITFLSPE